MQPKPSGILKAVRGTRDLLPPETALWNRVESVARDVFARYGFGEIRTPIFEATELFARGVGEETDIVSKEMYTWEDGERFDKEALRSRWYLDNQTRIVTAVVMPQEFVGVYFRAHENAKSEAVAFASRPDSRTIEQLKTADVNIKNDELGLTNPITIRRVVVPSPVPGKKEEWLTDSFVIEYVHGSFSKASQSITLRPENTAGVVRAYIEHKLGESGQLQKLFYIGPQFRRERPQRGRYRQFWQIGVEVLGPQSSGSESPVRDAEVLEMLATLLDELGVRDWELALNSVGSSDDRKRYNAALREALEPVKSRMCEDNQRRAETNPLRVLDSKEPADQEIIDALPKIADYLDADSAAHFAAVRAALDACGVPYTVNPRLVRGLDYYTRTTFEFTVPDGSGLGTQNALLGGGRYDGLSEMLGGPKAPGIGFAIGEDRLILVLQEQDGSKSVDAPHPEWMFAKKLDAYIAPIGAESNAAALALARELRRAGLSVEVGDGTFRPKKSFEAADKIARHIVLLGGDELATNTATVKTFATGEQVKVERSQLATILRT
jgi:histidyl-tRNA synthetase